MSENLMEEFPNIFIKQVILPENKVCENKLVK